MVTHHLSDAQRIAQDPKRMVDVKKCSELARVLLQCAKVNKQCSDDELLEVYGKVAPGSR